MAASSDSPDFTCDPADIYGNGGHLMRHVLEKGWQAGGVVGLFVVTPIQVVRHYRATGSWDGKLDRALRIGRKGAIGTLLVAGVVGIARIMSYEDRPEALADRAYRLHYNASQNRTDTFARVGALIGGVAAVASRGASLRTALGGGAIGSALGVLAHVATSSKETGSPMPNAMLDELKSG